VTEEWDKGRGSGLGETESESDTESESEGDSLKGRVTQEDCNKQHCGYE